MDTDTTTTEDLRAKAQKWVNSKPSDALVAAGIVGFLLALLPLGKILRALVGLAFSLLKPTLIVLGILKAVEEFQNACGASECCGSCDSEEEEEAVEEEAAETV